MRLIYKCGFCGKMTSGNWPGELDKTMAINTILAANQGFNIPTYITHPCDDVGLPLGVAPLVAVLND